MQIYIVLGIILGILCGSIYKISSYFVITYLAVIIVSMLDTLFGGMSSYVKDRFDIKIFVSGFIINTIFACLLVYIGDMINIEIYLACIIIFVGRILNNFGIIRRYYIEKIVNKVKEEKNNKKNIVKKEENNKKNNEIEFKISNVLNSKNAQNKKQK